MHRCDRYDWGRVGESGFDPQLLLDRAKVGDGPALGQLLDRYRNYLVLLIRLQLVRLRKTLDTNDLLQDIRLEIYRKSARYRGTSERDFLTWLRRVTGTVLANHLRHDLAAERRDLRFERALANELDQSSFALSESLERSSRSSLSHRAAWRDQAVLLADALQELPADYREVIILRQLEGLRFPDVACRLGRTEECVKGVWLRALARLRYTLEGLR
jgi:RNA polymerase sigma-70 factor, ECF subfamily